MIYILAIHDLSSMCQNHNITHIYHIMSEYNTISFRAFMYLDISIYHYCIVIMTIKLQYTVNLKQI